MTPSKLADFRHLNNLSIEKRENLSKRKTSRNCTVLLCIVILFSIVIGNLYRFEIINFNWGDLQIFSQIGIMQCQREFANPSCSAELPRSLQYCAKTVYGGSEGHFHGEEKWTLKRIALLIRHGDRSALHSLDDSGPKFKMNQKKGLYFSPEALQYVNQLNQIYVEKLSDGHINPALNESYIFRISDYDLQPGILTSTGFMQHIQQGKYLSKAYSKLINSINSPADIYVRSTNYDRTLQVDFKLLSREY